MPFLLFLAALAFAIAPLLSPEFGGFDADRFPIPQEDPPVQPAGYAFAIWGIIYAWLVIGTGFQMLNRREAEDWAPVRLPLIVSLGVGVAWLPVALSSPLWATVLIWIMWGGAVIALLRAPDRDAPFGRMPIALYTGWLTAASCVSLGLLGAGYGLMEETPAAVVALVTALVLSLGVMRQRPDAVAFPIAVVWALAAVTVANWPDGPRAVMGLATFGAALIAVSGLWLYRKA